MGVFGQVEIIIECENSEVVDSISDNIEKKVMDFIKEVKLFPKFNFNIDDIECHDEHIYLTITSDRAQNAEWQGEMVRDYLVENHKKDVVSISGEINTPDNFLYWNKDEE